jgi:hypothetical protein
MAVQWGSWSANGDIRVGIDITQSGSTVDVEYWVQTGPTGAYGDNQKLTFGGSITGTYDFYNNLGNNDEMLVTTKSRSVNAGQTYTFTVALSEAFDGSTPSKSRSFTAASGNPGPPTNMRFSDITETSAVVRWDETTNWGGHSDIWHRVQIDESVSFSSPTTYVVQNGEMKTLSSLDPGTLYHVRVRTENASGVSTYTPSESFTTDGSVSDLNPPGTPTFSNVTSVGMRVAWAQPATPVGNPVFTYYLSRSTNPDFSDATTIGTPTAYHNVTGLEPETLYYFKVRALYLNNELSAWSEASSEETLAGGVRIMDGGTFVDVPSLVKNEGVFVPVVPLKMVAGAWVY